MNEKPYTILHISDLHRSSSSSLSNEELISSLVQDRERYMKEDPRIMPPLAIVVSGDLIQGVCLGAENPSDEIRRQYGLAEEFLDGLAREFLEGDRSRLIIVPGNHDVDWNTACQAMEPIAEEKTPADLPAALHQENSDLRWDWRTRTLYRITDPQRYEKRMDAYWNFFERFYRDFPELSVKQSNRDFRLFSLHEGRIGIVAYNSCYRNDCFAHHGMISGKSIARSHMALEGGNAFELRVAVWHHSIEGPPYRADYMNIDTVRSMIGRGFRLGLYGHQHEVQVNPCEIRLPGRESMAVIGAGSLSAEDAELPHNTSRQYNLLEISPDLRLIRTHVRGMIVANLFSRAILPQFGGKSYEEMQLEPLCNSVGTPVNMRARSVEICVRKAEIAINDEKPQKAVELLCGLSLPPGSYERALFLHAANEAKDWSSVRQVIDTPETADELLLLYEAHVSSRDLDSALDALDRFSQKLKLSEDVENNLRGRIRVWRTIKS